MAEFITLHDTGKGEAFELNVDKIYTMKRLPACREIIPGMPSMEEVPGRTSIWLGGDDYVAVKETTEYIAATVEANAKKRMAGQW